MRKKTYPDVCPKRQREADFLSIGNYQKKHHKKLTMVRFLEKKEYASTIPLFTECFGDDPEFMAGYYGSVNTDGTCSGKIRDGYVAALEEDGKIVSMVQIRYYSAELIPGQESGSIGSSDGSNPGGSDSSGSTGTRGAGSLHFQVPYLMCICTDPAKRHRGYMDRVMQFVIDQMMYEGHPWCFLIPVDKAIYTHLGFLYEWKLNEQEQEMLYADEGLDTALARLLNAERFPEGEIRIRQELS